MEKLFKKSDKKKTTSSSSKKGKTGAGAMSSVSSDSRMLDIKSMNFEKFAYKNDKAYQAIKIDMVNYNASLSGKNTMENGQKTLKLMQDLLKKCSDYLYNNTTGEVVKHQARCENVENLIYEITMKGGTILKAQQNLEAMRGASEDQAKVNMMATELGYAVDGSKNNYSKTMQMITSDVLASQDATNNYDSMIEYDSVVNQALMLYEYQHPEDRSSQYYRQLKAMAFRAHIRRLEQRFANEEAEVENMANDGYTNLTPSAKGSMVNRAYERRASKMGWETTY